MHRTGVMGYLLCRAVGMPPADARLLLWACRPAAARNVGDDRLAIAEQWLPLVLHDLTTLHEGC